MSLCLARCSTPVRGHSNEGREGDEESVGLLSVWKVPFGSPVYHIEKGDSADGETRGDGEQFEEGWAGEKDVKGKEGGDVAGWESEGKGDQ